MIDVRNIAYVAYDVTNLDRSEAFMQHFGMKTQARRDGAVYLRATDDVNYAYVAYQAETPKLRSIAFEVRNFADLEAAAKMPGASGIEPIDAPGGGHRVSFPGPENLPFEAVYGIERVQPLLSRRAFKPNFANDMQRINSVVRIDKGPSDIRRISHVALYVHDAAAATDWTVENFGFLVSDYVDGPDGGPLFGSFVRPDNGSALVDHHVIAWVRHERVAIHHSSFWVEDFDALFNGADHLAKQGYFHEQGIGRHGAGSQVFSYWRDPDNFMIERFTDGDVFDATYPSQRNIASPSAIFQWGPEPKPTFFE